MTRDFPLGAILSITDGHLVARNHIDGVYEILNWMTGDNLFTHQLPRASKECRPYLLAQHPQLEAVVFPDGIEGAEAVYAWLDEQEAIYGETLPVEPLPEGAHERIEPMTELFDMAPGKTIIPIVIREEET